MFSEKPLISKSVVELRRHGLTPVLPEQLFLSVSHLGDPNEIWREGVLLLKTECSQNALEISALAPPYLRGAYKE